MKFQSLLCIVLFAFLTFVNTLGASAQFGGLFGGPKVESIETGDLAKLLKDQEQAEAKAKESGEKTPEPNWTAPL